MLSFYIALFDIGEPEAFHWALVATEINTPLTDPGHIFQVVTQEGCPGEDGYMTRHEISSLSNIDTFICAVRLPCLKTTMEELEDYMSTQYVGQQGTPIIDTPSRQWGCFQWAMRVIKGLIDKGVVIPESKNSFFVPKAAAAHRYWGPMIHVAGTKCAYLVQANSAVAHIHLGVRMMSFEDSGIHL